MAFRFLLLVRQLNSYVALDLTPEQREAWDKML